MVRELVVMIKRKEITSSFGGLHRTVLKDYLHINSLIDSSCTCFIKHFDANTSYIH